MKYFFFFLVIFLFSCKKENFLTKKEEFSYFIGKNFLVKSYEFGDFSTGESYNLLDNREIDTLYLIFRGDNMYLGKVEKISEFSFGVGVDKYFIRYYDDRIKIMRDDYNDFSVTFFSNESIVLMGKHTLHNQEQSIKISITEIKDLTPNLENIINRFVVN